MNNILLYIITFVKIYANIISSILNNMNIRQEIIYNLLIGKRKDIQK